jgi:hypothetical protein
MGHLFNRYGSHLRRFFYQDHGDIRRNDLQKSDERSVIRTRKLSILNLDI